VLILLSQKDQVWSWHTPLTLALGRKRQAEFEDSLVYRASSRIAKASQRNPVSLHPTSNTKQAKRPDVVVQEANSSTQEGD